MKAIYTITNLINGKRYIGSTKSFYRRRSSHLHTLRKNKHHSPHLQNAWNKYGEENFKFIILEKIEDLDKLVEREQWWIDNTPCEYNVCKVAGTGIGIKWSDEARAKFSKIRKGSTLSDETKRKISQSKKESYSDGLVHGMLGKKHTEEAREKIRISKLGSKKSEETKRKMSESGLKKDTGRKKINQYTKEMEFIKQWSSISEASRNLGIAINAISSNLNGKTKSSGGYIWKVLD